MGVDALIPVNEALDINNVACLEVSECLVNIGLGIGEVTLYTEAVGLAILGNVNVKPI